MVECIGRVFIYVTVSRYSNSTTMGTMIGALLALMCVGLCKGYFMPVGLGVLGVLVLARNRE